MYHNLLNYSQSKTKIRGSGYHVHPLQNIRHKTVSEFEGLRTVGHNYNVLPLQSFGVYTYNNLQTIEH